MPDSLLARALREISLLIPRTSAGSNSKNSGSRLPRGKAPSSNTGPHRRSRRFRGQPNVNLPENREIVRGALRRPAHPIAAPPMAIDLPSPVCLSLSDTSAQFRQFSLQASSDETAGFMLRRVGVRAESGTLLPAGSALRPLPLFFVGFAWLARRSVHRRSLRVYSIWSEPMIARVTPSHCPCCRRAGIRLPVARSQHGMDVWGLAAYPPAADG